MSLQPKVKLPDSATVTVCDKCNRATCWNGEFYCDGYKTAGIVARTVSELRALNLEHEDYFAYRRGDAG